MTIWRRPYLIRLLPQPRTHHRNKTTKSALLVTGRNADKQFAVFTPNTNFKWIQEHEKIIQKVNLERNIDLLITVISN